LLNYTLQWSKSQNGPANSVNLYPTNDSFTLVGLTSNQTVYFGLYASNLHGQGSPVDMNATTSGATVSYPVTFVEQGLPAGTPWSVALGSTPGTSTNPSIVIPSSNGTYLFRVINVTGFTANPFSGSLSVGGQAVTQNVTFSPVPIPLYNVTFIERGLPPGTPWTVALGAQLNGTASTTMSFPSPNGTYRFVVGGVGGYTVAPSSGNIAVGGTAPPPTTLSFTPLVQLLSVSVNPLAALLLVGGSANFTAAPLCTGGACPAQTTLRWVLNSTLGSLSSSTGNSTTFTAGMSPGEVSLSVEATLGGFTLESAPSNITLTQPPPPPSPSLASVAITPPTTTLFEEGTQAFSSSIQCAGGTCPQGATYNWSLSDALGTLGPNGEGSINFTASGHPGAVLLSVNVSLGNLSRSSIAVINIVAPANNGSLTHYLAQFFATADIVLLVGPTLVVIAAFAILARIRNRKSEGPSK
jgi:hypothetical protein